MNDYMVILFAILPFVLVVMIGPSVLGAVREHNIKESRFRGNIVKDKHRKQYFCHKCGKEVNFKDETCASCGATLFTPTWSAFHERDSKIIMKITMIAENFELSLIRDYTDYAAELIECGNTFASTITKMTQNNICEYFRPGTFSSKDIDSLNGEHFLFGFVETIAQEPKYANLLSDFDEITFVVERIYE